MAIEQDAMTVEEKIFEKLEAADAPPVEEPSKVEATQTEETTEVAEDAAEVEEVSAEGKDAEVDEVEESPEEPWMPETLDQLAEAMQVDTDDVKSIRVKTKVDGVEGEATLAEVLKNYQLNKSLTEKSEAFAQERKAFENEVAQFKQAADEKMAAAESVTQVMEEKLKAEIASIDWQQLRADNPAEYAVQRQEYTEKIGELEGMKQNLIAERQQEMQKQQQQYQQYQQQVVQHNTQELLKAVPEYADEKVRTKDLSDIKAYMRSQNISDQEIATIVDYRMVLLAKKAMAYDQMQSNASPAKAKAKTKPMFTKPGNQKTSAANQKTADDKLRNKFRKSGSVDDAASLILNRLR